MPCKALNKTKTAKIARKKLLTGDAYLDLPLPSYFSKKRIGEGLRNIAEYLSKRDFNSLIRINELKSIDNANYSLYMSKNNKYSWRIIELLHPVLYAHLVNLITKKGHWELIFSKLNHNSKPNILVASNIIIPCESLSETKSRSELEINNWYRLVELKSLQKATEYTQLLHADIFDFYGQIYTHTIAWALHGREVIKNALKANGNQYIEKYFLGGKIDKAIRLMRGNQSNGIPQGSAVMDLIAETVLSYADEKLSEKIKGLKTFIIRYRDDYRIFAADQETIAEANRTLVEVLHELGLRLNDGKTRVYNDVVQGSIKEDKWGWITSTHEIWMSDKELQNKSLLPKRPHHFLLALYKHVLEYPFPSQVLRGLNLLNDSLRKKDTFLKDRDSAYAFIGVLINIADKFPKSIPQVMGIISTIVKNWRADEIEDLMLRIQMRFEKRVNLDFLEIWLQRIALPHGIDFSCRTKLCKVVNKEIPAAELWESSWINARSLKRLISDFQLIDLEVIKNIKSSENKDIPPDETELFIHQFS